MTRKKSAKTDPRRRPSKSWALGAKVAPQAIPQDAVKEAVATKGILLRTPVATWRRLKHISADHDKTLQTLLLEAVEYIIETYGDRRKV